MELQPFVPGLSRTFRILCQRPLGQPAALEDVTLLTGGRPPFRLLCQRPLGQPAALEDIPLLIGGRPPFHLLCQRPLGRNPKIKQLGPDLNAILFYLMKSGSVRLDDIFPGSTNSMKALMKADFSGPAWVLILPPT